MIDLLKLEPNKVTKDLKSKYILLYSAPKAGKTTFAASIPKSLLLAFERGYNGLEGVMAVDIPKWGDFTQILRQLEKQEVKDRFDVVIIDTLDLMWSCAEKYVLAQNQTSSGETPKALGDIPWGGGFTQCKKLFDESLRKIAMLGYGVVLISHSKTVTKRNDNGVEYDYISCSLPDMAKLIANRFVDLICYLKMDDEGKRWLYTRDSENKYHIEVGSRFQYLDEKIPLGYEALTEALNAAIQKEAEIKGRQNVSSERKEDGFLKEEKSFDQLIAEAKSVFDQLMAQDKEQNIVKTNDILTKHFGKPTKLSAATEAQRELVEAVLEDWKQLL